MIFFFELVMAIFKYVGNKYSYPIRTTFVFLKLVIFFLAKIIFISSSVKKKLKINPHLKIVLRENKINILLQIIFFMDEDLRSDHSITGIL